MPRFFSLLLALGCSFSHVLAVSRNYTVDDTIPDPAKYGNVLYQPQTLVWARPTDAQAKTQEAKAYNGTWTNALVTTGAADVVVTVQFEGTGIYLYFVESSLPTVGEIHLDGDKVGDFSGGKVTSTSEPFRFNTLVYGTGSLVNGSHSISFISIDQETDNWLAFDYAIYTLDDGSAATGPTSPVGVSGSPTGAPKPTPSGGGLTVAMQSMMTVTVVSLVGATLLALF